MPRIKKTDPMLDGMEDMENQEDQEDQETKADTGMEPDEDSTPAPKDPEELVEIELFYDGEKYSEPVPVLVNGTKILVPRGKPVKIKRKYFEVLENSRKQDRQAGRMMRRMEAEFASESRARSIEIE